MRAVQETVALLQKAGHEVRTQHNTHKNTRNTQNTTQHKTQHNTKHNTTQHLQVVPWTPPELPAMFDVFVQLLLADKGFHFCRQMADEVGEGRLVFIKPPLFLYLWY